MNLDDIGVSTVKDSTAFKKIQFFSKTNPTNLFNVKSDFQNSLNNLNSVFLNDLDLNQSYTYGMDRQHAFTSLSAALPASTTLMDRVGVNKFLSYTLNQNIISNNNNLDLNRLNYSSNNKSSSANQESLVSLYSKILPSQFRTPNNIDFSVFLKLPNIGSVLSAESDSKQYTNLFKFILHSKHKKKSIQNFNFVLNNTLNNETPLNTLDPTNTFSNTIFNTENTLKFKDYKSSNAQFLGSERTVRLLNNLNSNSYR
jgi:hypothetical protein